MHTVLTDFYFLHSTHVAVLIKIVYPISAKITSSSKKEDYLVRNIACILTFSGICNRFMHCVLRKGQRYLRALRGM